MQSSFLYMGLDVTTLKIVPLGNCTVYDFGGFRKVLSINAQGVMFKSAEEIYRPFHTAQPIPRK